MPTIDQIKEQEVTSAPLLLFECVLPSGAVERWSTHQTAVEEETYQARIVAHNLFEVRAGGDDAIDAMSKLSVTLANVDSHFSQIERSEGWKGARLTVRFVFFDLAGGIVESESRIVFRGVANPPDEITEATCRLTFTSRMNQHRVQLPEVRIQKRCPWMFPASAGQRAEAIEGGPRGKYNPLYRCGYSADQSEGAGNLDGAGTVFESCDYTKAGCEQRGMYKADSSGRATARFGGVQYVPSTIAVRSYGESGWHAGPTLENTGRYNDPVPLVYGTAWYQPPIVFARNDGNLTHFEVLLGLGEMNRVVKVIVNDIEIPAGQAGADMTATGWFNVVSLGARNGSFNEDFSDGKGCALGDPYGGMALLSVVTPNRISDGKALPKVQVLAEGLKLPTYGSDGDCLGEVFTNNPAWVLLDLLRRTGWSPGEIDLLSFSQAAAYCSELVAVSDLHGNPSTAPRFQCNLALRKRRSAADAIRGVRNGAGLLLRHGSTGLLELVPETTIAKQQPVRPAGSNSTAELDGGWPAYEFGDGSNGFGGILRKANGEPQFRVWSRSTAETPNRLTIEFQDSFNEYQQDGLSLVDMDDVVRGGQEISAPLTALGVACYEQAVRIARQQLDKTIHGNTYIDFETSVKGIGLRPGDLIAVTYLKEGFERQPFRVVRVSPSANWRSTAITAQIHSDEWYDDGPASGRSQAGRQPSGGLGMPRPLAGTRFDDEGNPEFEVIQACEARADGGVRVVAGVGFAPPAKPAASMTSAPLIGFSPEISTSGGTLPGGQTLYYGVTGSDADGSESRLSFIARAEIPEGANTNAVTLTGLSFPAHTTGFNVYRGPSPWQVWRIATGAVPSAQCTDNGEPAEPGAPPDENFDHANFYWRLELQPESGTTSHTASTVGNSGLAMQPDGYRGTVVRITKGHGRGQERTVLSNSETSLTIAPAWVIEPDATSRFVVAESAWHFGALAGSGPVSFEIPNREGATVHISGRAANVNDLECPYELSPISRWTIRGASGTGQDQDVPPQPAFSLSKTGQGTVELAGIAFESLTNTSSVTAGTLTLHYRGELDGPGASSLSASVVSTDEYIDVTPAWDAAVGDTAQVEREIVAVLEKFNGGTRLRVERGACGSSAAAHDAQSALEPLRRQTTIASFPRNFFGSPASGDFVLSMPLLDGRVAAAELFVTNERGNSPTGRDCYTGSGDRGMRTLAGGQLNLQVEGHLAIETSAVPVVAVNAARSAGDVRAVVAEAPAGSPIELRLTRNGVEWCTLTIAEGQTMSATVNGAGLNVLNAEDLLGLDVLGVGTAFPGKDLTVTVRL